MEKEQVLVQKHKPVGKIDIVSVSSEATPIQTEIKKITSNAAKISEAYEMFGVSELISSDLTDFSAYGKTLFETINPGIFKQLDHISGGATPTMEDWRSLDWVKILPEDVQAGTVNNRAIHLLWTAHYYVDQNK